MISVAELAGTEREAIGPGFSTKDLGTKIDAVPKSKGKTLIDRAHHLEALRLLLKLGLFLEGLCFFNQPWGTKS